MTVWKIMQERARANEKSEIRNSAVLAVGATMLLWPRHSSRNSVAIDVREETR